MIQNSKKIEYDPDSNKIFVMNARLATQINTVLKTYDSGNYIFQAGEEAIFKVPPDLIHSIQDIVNQFK